MPLSFPRWSFAHREENCLEVRLHEAPSQHHACAGKGRRRRKACHLQAVSNAETIADEGMPSTIVHTSSAATCHCIMHSITARYTLRRPHLIGGPSSQHSSAEQHADCDQGCLPVPAVPADAAMIHTGAARNMHILLYSSLRAARLAIAQCCAAGKMTQPGAARRTRQAGGRRRGWAPPAAARRAAWSTEPS